MKSIRYIHTKFLSKVAKFEGFRSSPYQDSGGTWTIGFGHTKGVTKHTPPISYDDALVLLAIYSPTSYNVLVYCDTPALYHRLTFFVFVLYISY